MAPVGGTASVLRSRKGRERAATVEPQAAGFEAPFRVASDGGREEGTASTGHRMIMASTLGSRPRHSRVGERVQGARSLDCEVVSALQAKSSQGNPFALPIC